MVLFHAKHVNPQQSSDDRGNAEENARSKVLLHAHDKAVKSLSTPNFSSAGAGPARYQDNVQAGSQITHLYQAALRACKVVCCPDVQFATAACKPATRVSATVAGVTAAV